jgi:hypothetical protein
MSLAEVDIGGANSLYVDPTSTLTRRDLLASRPDPIIVSRIA